MSTILLDTAGLSDDQLVFIQGIINLLKTPSKKEKTQARAALKNLWKKIETIDMGLTEQEANDLIDEAIMWARHKI